LAGDLHAKRHVLMTVDGSARALVEPFFVVRPAGRTHLEVEVLYQPDRGND